ncbi:MAG: formylglycine-generating enzyme family protein [Kiritimatiellae bacterium]|nr:formylglycine-generating enzyme family protein [Kiritimatiellia bacterium]
MKQIVAICAVSACLAAAGAVPEVTSVSWRANSARDYVVSYTLSSAPAIVTVDVRTNGVSIGPSNFTSVTGAANRWVTDASTGFVWHAREDWPGRRVRDGALSFHLTAHPVSEPPDYMLVDISTAFDSQGGGFPVRYYESEEALPYGDIRTGVRYRTDFLLMKRIRAKGVTWQMGSHDVESERETAGEALHDVTLTNDYYMGVFEVTQKQWKSITGSSAPAASFAVDGDIRPKDNVSIVGLREMSSITGKANLEQNPAYQWPNAPFGNSFFGKLRWMVEKVDHACLFDLPSEAQWEYAARGGVNAANRWNDGSARLASGIHVADANLSRLGRNKMNGGYIYENGAYSAPTPGTCSTEYGTAPVGSYEPNGYGLYDMHGNVWEWCLDWWAEDVTGLNGAVNANGKYLADGVTEGAKRVQRGGAWSLNAVKLYRTSYRDSARMSSPATYDYTQGFRVCLTIP